MLVCNHKKVESPFCPFRKGDARFGIEKNIQEEKLMIKTRKPALIIIVLIAAMLFCAIFGGCNFAETGGGSSGGPTVEKPQPAAEVQSVSVRYNGSAVSGLLSVELDLGSIQLAAQVVMDDGADGTVTWQSGTPAVAQVDQNGLVTLNAGGETVISASAGGKTASFVLSVTQAAAADKEYTITVNGGAADYAAAHAGTMVTLTPQIPQDKVFRDWLWDESIYTVYGNSFIMPEGDVTISAEFSDKLSDIRIVSLPDDNRIVAGGSFVSDGLKILARSVTGEEWDVTGDVTYSEYDGGESITATYSLGNVTRAVQIPVVAFSGYTVTSESFRDLDGVMNEAPKDIYDSSYDGYKESGFIASSVPETGGTNNGVKFSVQGSTFCVSNITTNRDIIFYFWSDFEGNAHINSSIASADYYDTTGGGGTPNAVRDVVMAEKFQLYVNQSEEATKINPAAIAAAYQQETPSWSVCGHFNDAWLADMAVVKGWNSVRLACVASESVNIAGIRVDFTGEELTEFASDIKINLNTAANLAERPDSLDQLPDSYRSTGAFYLERDPSVTDPNGMMKLSGNENGHGAITNMHTGESVTYYFWSEGNGMADIVLTAASSRGSSTHVYGVDMTTQYEVSVNSVITAITEGAAYSEHTWEQPDPSNQWLIFQQFEDVTVCTARIEKGWNSFELKMVGENKISPAELNVKFVYQQ